MTSVLSLVRATAHRSPLIAALICFLLAQVIMADMPDPRDQRIATLRTWFHTSSPDGPVNEEGIQDFLNEVGDIHFMPLVAADGRAAAITDAGYTSVHDIAGITCAELQTMGFLQGNAKRLSSYLGSKPRDVSPNRVLPAGPLSVVASQQHSAQIGAAVAMAVTTAQTKIKLNDGSTSNPTVSCVVKWAKKHLEKTNISGYGTVTTILQLLIDDLSMDLTPHITAEPAVSADKGYAREVSASLTPDQIQKFGGGEKESSVLLIQNVMKYIADMKMSVYVTHATAFNAVSSTVDAHAVRGRFNNFTSLLNEVRFHKMFELKDAIKKIVAVVAPNVFLVNEVLAMWNLSAKDQKALTAIIKYVKDEVDVPDAADATPKKRTSLDTKALKVVVKVDSLGTKALAIMSKTTKVLATLTRASKVNARTKSGSRLAPNMTSLEPTPTRPLLSLK